MSHVLFTTCLLACVIKEGLGKANEFPSVTKASILRTMSGCIGVKGKMGLELNRPMRFNRYCEDTHPAVRVV